MQTSSESPEHKQARLRRKVVNFLRYSKRMEKIYPKWGTSTYPYFRFLGRMDAAGYRYHHV